ncbi:hypothetical protein BpHYR1_022070 [Brachionus plicatilis]|uniref:Uncharacterized protein n=1 Tax=Brachionus plicatilis TaxID=10195 RepID=A0A3M7PSZ5_BRAPC|nr:hypothetical protein BpHYR1_022070 [Brachionus plicatilis]
MLKISTNQIVSACDTPTRPVEHRHRRAKSYKMSPRNNFSDEILDKLEIL